MIFPKLFLGVKSDRLLAEFHAVSIHAPAGGATVGVIEEGTRVEFQSTRPQGARRAKGL